MRITNLTGDSKQYTSNVYLIPGAWNTMDDVTTMVDAGSIPIITVKINNIHTGLGKKKIDQVIATHRHSDYASL